jgi:CheY-like chemotaxis protein
VTKLLDHRHFDIILSDIVMPGMSGLELARSISKQHPDVMIILASGYSDKAELVSGKASLSSVNHTRRKSWLGRSIRLPGSPFGRSTAILNSLDIVLGEVDR